MEVMEDLKSSNESEEDEVDLFYEAPDDFPFVDCSDRFSDCEDTQSVKPNFSPENEDSPSPASSLRRRRSLSRRASGCEATNFSPSVSFENYLNSRDRKFSFSSKLLENSNSNSNLNSIQFDLSTGGKDISIIGEGSKENSTITNANDLVVVNSENVVSHLKEDCEITGVNNTGTDHLDVVDSHLREADYPSPNLLLGLASVVIKAVGFQVNLLIFFVSLMIKLAMFPVWLIYSSYMFVMDPFRIMRFGKQYVMHKFMGTFGVVVENMMKFVSEWVKERKSVWRLGLKFGWGCLWSVYVCVVLVGLLISAFIIGGILTRIFVEEPIRMKEPLNFDYTVKSPVAFVPIIRSPSVTCGVDRKDEVDIRQDDRVQVIPPNHRLQVTVALTLPESDYNRNLGIFQVRVDFLAANGKLLSSLRRPSMLHFKSLPIRLLSTFLKAAPLVTGYTSESQKLEVGLKGFTEGVIPTACLRVAIEQRAEFHPGGGIPEMYAASLTLESELPLLKRIIWFWKTTLFVWVSMTLFILELLFALLCCKPLIIPRVRLRNDSNTGNASRNNLPNQR